MFRYKNTYSLLACVNKAKFWVDSWHPYLIISKNFTDQEKKWVPVFLLTSRASIFNFKMAATENFILFAK